MTLPPCPTLPLHVDVPTAGDAPVDCSPLPAQPGVFVFRDDQDRAITIAVTANLRRLVRSRLQPPNTEDGPSRRIDYRQTVRSVDATTVGSAFEADWAYLQLARRLMPHSYRGLTDRWKGWFVHTNAETQFPRWVKTSSPGGPPTGKSGVYLGPMADKHAAQRYIEMLDDAFDLCRYHHILIEAPHAAPCVYKEMGKCPAPCDGSISMDAYREQVRAAVAFASTPIDRWREQQETKMREAGETLDFESAERFRALLEATSLAAKPAFAHVDRLERLRFIVLAPGETPGRVRLFTVRGGWIEPLLDTTADIVADDLAALLEAHFACEAPTTESDVASDNIGLLCNYLFRPKAKRGLLHFTHARGKLDGAALVRAIRSLLRKLSAEAEDEAAMPDRVTDVAE